MLKRAGWRVEHVARIERSEIRAIAKLEPPSRISRSLSSGRPLRAGPVGSIRATDYKFSPGAEAWIASACTPPASSLASAALIMRWRWIRLFPRKASDTIYVGNGSRRRAGGRRGLRADEEFILDMEALGHESVAQLFRDQIACVHGKSMIPKSGNRFSDKIMLHTKGLPSAYRPGQFQRLQLLPPVKS